jgi:hypothetical protein
MFKTRLAAALPAKVTGTARDWAGQGRVVAILKVSEDGHVPDGVQVRSRIDAGLFTGEFDAPLLHAIAADPRVLALSPQSRVQADGDKP